MEAAVMSPSNLNFLNFFSSSKIPKATPVANYPWPVAFLALLTTSSTVLYSLNPKLVLRLIPS